MQNDKSKSKIIVVLGPTSSGKSALAVRLARKFNGEIVSADSRQVYKGMDIGTGKITKKEMRGIPHHLLDVASPKRRFTVVQYRKRALAAIQKIMRKRKIPFLVGGTGFYIQAVADGIAIPEARPDWKLRRSLEKKSAEALFEKLKKLDPERAKTVEKKNKRRLIRALEIILKTKRPIPELKKQPLAMPILFLGIRKNKGELKKLIKNRLLKRLGRGMVAEVKKLKKSGISWKKLEEFGLEYGYVARYLQKKITYSEMVRQLQKASEDYARRQMTWFKRDKRVLWIKNYQEAEKLAREFVNG